MLKQRRPIARHARLALPASGRRAGRLAGRPARSLAVLGLLSLAVVALGACSSDGGSSPVPSASADPGAALEGNTWQATEIAGIETLVKDAQVTAKFMAGTLSGSGGVNTYSAGYTVTAPDGIAVSQPAATLMAGPEDAMTQEAAYFAALAKAVTFAVTADQLTLSDDAGSVLVRYAVLEPAALEGTEWHALAYNNGKGGLQSVATDGEITASFGADGSLAGNASVNQYSTTYTTSGETMTIEAEIVTTRMAGSEELMVQEAAYLAALPKTAAYTIEGDELWLRDAEGAALAHYTAR